MTTEADPKARGMMLKRLRQAHQETVQQAQEKLKEQKEFRRQMCKTIRQEALSIPEIAEQSGLPADQILWHITALKKYELVIEDGMCGEYYRYRVAEGAKI
jgi:predicted Rossmann fold nucleotide-binding protein DprA/Smf involved in DNA uptake